MRACPSRLIPLALLGALALSACSSSSGDGGFASPGTSSGGSGGRPQLPTGVEVRFPAAPANAYLSLLTEDGTGVYQLGVAAGKTSIEVDPGKWAAQSANAEPIEDLLPKGAAVSPAEVKVRLLHWVMWQDANTNGKRDDGETLDLMTHDRAAYASAAVSVSFKTETPNMTQTWNLAAGWSRAEHFVYLPKATGSYVRRLETAQVQRYTLHVNTPITSQ